MNVYEVTHGDVYGSHHHHYGKTIVVHQHGERFFGEHHQGLAEACTDDSCGWNH